LDLPAQIAQTMSAYLKPDDIVIVQLGIGGHVDHVTVRRAAEMLKRPLIYDADIPYFRIISKNGGSVSHAQDAPRSSSRAR
jgi:molybdopterin-biosynthesis enzyme MoeA-like protein